ncbi:phosphomannomutase/phosphoglucomutase [bacterium]|nr:phosphomannomutase/phosphoglucomutase [bacterium]
MAGIFHAYDIRGVYQKDLTPDIAERIGLALSNFLSPTTCVVGRDMRDGGIALADAIGTGLRKGGCGTIDIGLCSTPMNYFAIANYGYDAGVQVTASHNTAEYNGFKICQEDAKPLSYEGGLSDIEQLAAKGNLTVSDENGERHSRRITKEYHDYVLSWVDANSKRKLKIVVDAGNGIAGVDSGPVWDRLPHDTTRLYFEPDAKFPNHVPDPMKPENLTALIAEVKSRHADLGIAFDGDADRVVFVDETGAAAPSDSITALLAEELLRKNKGAKIIIDLRSSWAAREAVQAAGGVPVIYRVGHSYIKTRMRELSAVFAGELSGHYYFRDNFFTDSGIIASLILINILTRTGKPLSALIQPYAKYHRSGERNFRVASPKDALARLEKAFSEGAKKVEKIDGLSVEFDGWWFNARASNTEPVMRLNVESKSADELQEKLAKIEAMLRA